MNSTINSIYQSMNSMRSEWRARTGMPPPYSMLIIHNHVLSSAGGCPATQVTYGKDGQISISTPQSRFYTPYCLLLTYSSSLRELNYYLLDADIFKLFLSAGAEICGSSEFQWLWVPSRVRLSILLSNTLSFLVFLPIKGKSMWSLLKCGWQKAAAAFLSAFFLVNPYMLSWRTNEEQRECLKQWGSTASSNACTHTKHKSRPDLSHLTMWEYSWERAISLSLVRKEGTGLGFLQLIQVMLIRLPVFSNKNFIFVFVSLHSTNTRHDEVVVCMVRSVLNIIIMFQIEFDTKEIEGALPDYKYIKKVGSGALAVVHLVENRQTGQQMALKKVCCFGLGEHEKAGAANEARILSSLDHKNVIKVKSCLFDNAEDIMYIFMEYAESGDLTLLIEQAKQKKKRIPESTIWKVISDVSEGLRYLHQNQIIHRDIKPANVFRMGKCFKIGDLNVSKVVKNGEVASTKTGSPLYTAPEVWNSQDYNSKCDVWSLGVMVYEMVCMKVPYQADNIIELVRKIKEQKLKSIPSIYSPTLDDLIKRMLQISPTKRISPQQIAKIAGAKLKLETQGLNDEGVDELMDTIIFPDTHQRWINLIPSPLPPKTNRKQVSKSQLIVDKVRSNSKQRTQQSELMIVSSNAFRSSERQIAPPSSKSRGKAQAKVEGKNELRVPVSSLPPIYRSNSPIAQRKKVQQKQQQIKQKKIERDRSSSRTKRQSAIQLVIQSKSILNNNS